MSASERRYWTSAFGRSSDPSRGRESSGLEEMCAIRWSAQSRIARSASQNSVSEGLCPGRCWTSSVRPRSASASPSCSGARHRRGSAPAAKARRDAAQRRDHLLGYPVAEHQPGGELIVALGVGAVSLYERDDDVDRGHVGARARGDDLDQPEVVDVLVGDHDQLEVLDRVADGLELAGELVERFARVRPGVDEGQRPVVDQVAVDAPDGERGRDPESVDAGIARSPERLLWGHARIRARISSRLRSMSSREISDSRLRRSSGSVLEGRTLKCQSG